MACSCSKDCKKFGLAAMAAIVLVSVMEYVIHNVILMEIYMRPYYQHLWNPPDVMGRRIPAMLLGYVVFGILFTKIYTYGYEESKPVLGQGFRYGLLIGIMISCLQGLVSFAVYPISLKLAGAWLIGGIIECVVLGMVVALIYKPKTETL